MTELPSSSEDSEVQMYIDYLKDMNSSNEQPPIISEKARLRARILYWQRIEDETPVFDMVALDIEYSASALEIAEAYIKDLLQGFEMSANQRNNAMNAAGDWLKIALMPIKRWETSAGLVPEEIIRRIKEVTDTIAWLQD